MQTYELRTGFFVMLHGATLPIIVYAQKFHLDQESERYMFTNGEREDPSKFNNIAQFSASNVLYVANQDCLNGEYKETLAKMTKPMRMLTPSDIKALFGPPELLQPQGPTVDTEPCKLCGQWVCNCATTEINTAMDGVASEAKTATEFVKINPVPTPRLNKIMAFAKKEAKNNGDAWISAEHVLVGMMIEGENSVSMILKRNFTLEQMRNTFFRKEEQPDATPMIYSIPCPKCGHIVQAIHEPEKATITWEGKAGFGFSGETQ